MSYIGNSPGVASQRVVTNLTATSGQTRFVAQSGYTLGYIDVLRNGIDLVLGEDYTAIDGIGIDLTVAATANDKIKLVAYIPRGLSDGWTKDEADARFVNTTADTVALAANGFSVGTNQLVVNSGNVGIGTLSIPYNVANRKILVVNGGQGSGEGALIALTQNNIAKGYLFSISNDMELWCESGTVTIGNNAASPIIFKTNNTERIRIASTGEVGIGTSSPQRPLQINGGSTNGIRIQETVSGGDKRLELYVDTSTAVATIAADQSAQQLAFRTNGSERVRISSTGLVGIGTSNPGAKLEVYGGGIDITGSNAPLLRLIENAATGNPKIQLLDISNASSPTEGLEIHYESTTGNSYFKSLYTDGIMAFSTANTERVRITSVGRLLINTTVERQTLTISGSTHVSNNSYLHCQTTGVKTVGASGTWTPLCFCDHTHSLSLRVMAIAAAGVNTGCAAWEGAAIATYGAGGTTTTASRVFGSISQIDTRYNNSGYQLEVYLVYSGSAPTISYSASGVSFGAVAPI